jgi:acetoin utilization protein AcuB
MRIRDVVTPTVCARYEEPSSLVLDRIRTAGVEHLIITRQGKIVGVASEKDLALACALNVDAPVGDSATEVPILTAEAPVKDAANLMRSHKVGCVPVVDDDVIAGIVTIDKLLELIGRGAIHTLPNRERRILKDRGPKRRSGRR